MKRAEIIQRIIRECSVQIPSIQRQYGISYKDAKSIIDELVATGEFAYVGGVNYGRVEKPYIPEPARIERTKPEEKKPFTLREYFENRLKNEAGNFDINDETELKRRALRLCIRNGTASATFLQRSFPIGYIQACKLLDWMEEQGCVSAPNGPFARKILITEDEIEEKLRLEKLDASEESPFDESDNFQDEQLKLLKETERQGKIDSDSPAKALHNLINRVQTEILPAHPSWNNEFEFRKEVRQKIEDIVKSDRNMGVKGAEKRAEACLAQAKDKKTAEVFERVVYEFRHTTPYEYSKLKKKYF